MNGEGDRRGMGKKMERKRWKSESEKVNGERGEFDEYAANGKKVKSDFS